MINQKPILRKGSGFETPELKPFVEKLQTLLKKGGFLPQKTLNSGLFDLITEKAVIAFQYTENLLADGVVNPFLWDYLETYCQGNILWENRSDTAKLINSTNFHSHPSHPILEKGDGINTPARQDQVKYLQNLLKQLNYLPENTLIDGLFWQKTEEAVKNFQKKFKLLDNGIVNQETWEYLEREIILSSLKRKINKDHDILNNNLSLYSANNMNETTLGNNPQFKSNYPTLMMGDGLNTPHLQEEVKYLQELLKNQKLLPQDFSLDGLFWQETELAVRQLQHQHNLIETGIVSQEIWQILEPQFNQENLLNITTEVPSKTNHISPEDQGEPLKVKPLETQTIINSNVTDFRELGYRQLKLGDGLQTPSLQEEVKYLQKLLQDQGFLSEDFLIDGLFWEETQEAVEAFQRSKNLAVTGLVNSSTWMALENKSAQELPSEIQQENNSNQFIFQQDLTENIANISEIDQASTENQEIIEKNYVTLQLGSGIDTPQLQNEVNYLQTLLQEWGVLALDLELNGLFWRETEEAVKLFQQRHNLKITGVVDQDTWRTLEGIKNDAQLSENLEEPREQISPLTLMREENSVETINSNIIPIEENFVETITVNSPAIPKEEPAEDKIINNIIEILGETLPSSAPQELAYSYLKIGDGIYNVTLKEEVKLLQTMLKKAKFLEETALIDGLFWHKTEAAVKAFQEHQNLVADGLVDLKTWKALENFELPPFAPSPIPPITKEYPELKLGDGINTPELQSTVKELQLFLRKYQFLPANSLIDGLFWRITETAVKAFQKSQNLPESGIVNDLTWRKINDIEKSTQTTHLPNFQSSSLGPKEDGQQIEKTAPISLKETNKNESNSYPILKIGDGMSNQNLQPDVKRLQTLLKEHKFLPENMTVDGLFWRETETAVKEFQKSKKLVADGVVEEKTWKALEKEPVNLPVVPPQKKYPVLKLRDGIDTPQFQGRIKELQNLLKKWNFLHQNTVIDGLFWKTTEEAVKAFQKSQNLPDNGIVDQKTWELLEQNPPEIELTDITTEKIEPQAQAEITINNINNINNGENLMSTEPVLRLQDGIATPHLRDAVRQLQTLLKRWNFLPENAVVDGLFGNQTDTAVRAFQRSQNLLVDGIVGAKTWELLRRNPPQTVTPTPATPVTNTVNRYPILRFGDGIDFPELINDVKTLQNFLRQSNLINIVDGLFGRGTENAVKTFQRNNNLTPDGIVGQQTWSLLTKQTVNTYVPPRNSNNNNLVNKLLQAISNTTIRQYAAKSIPLILQEAQKYNVVDRGQIAYILATAQHESRLGQWMVEFASGQAYEGRRDLGNTQPGDGPRYKGRGFVQITGRRNYTDWSARLGIDLVKNPERATEYSIAAKILVLGMRDGTFTTLRLGQYVNGDRRDFYNARRVVNGLDQATHIAGLAENFFRAMS